MFAKNLFTRQFSFRLMAYNEMTQASVDFGLVWPYLLSPSIIRHLDLILPKKDLMADRLKAIGQEPDRWHNCKSRATVIQ